MRLFVAIVPPPQVCADAARRVAQLPSALRAELKRIAPERFHLTLAFLGDVDEQKVGPLTDCLRSVADHTPALDLQLATAGHFDGRVLWLGVCGDVEPLHRLADNVAAAVTDIGLTLRQKPHRPHLTVARTRGSLDVLAAVADLATYDGQPWRAEQLTLMRSRLGPIPAYERQGVWALPAKRPATRTAPPRARPVRA